MDEDLDEDAVADELMPVDAQRAFVAEMLGRKDEAAEGYRAALAIESTDAATRAIVANNLAALVGSRGGGGAQRGALSLSTSAARIPSKKSDGCRMKRWQARNSARKPVV